MSYCSWNETTLNDYLDRFADKIEAASRNQIGTCVPANFGLINSRMGVSTSTT